MVTLREEKKKAAVPVVTAKIAHLRKHLYQRAMFALKEGSRRDGEAVRALRDQATLETSGKLYEECTESELRDAIEYFEVKPELASKKQLALFRFYAIACALYYYDWDNARYYDAEARDVFEGTAARDRVVALFESEKRVPPAMFRNLFETWINPKSHKFMIEGEFKKRTVNPNKFHYEYLTTEQAQYLIKRYSEIYQNISVTARIDGKTFNN